MLNHDVDLGIIRTHIISSSFKSIRQIQLPTTLFWYQQLKINFISPLTASVILGKDRWWKLDDQRQLFEVGVNLYSQRQREPFWVCFVRSEISATLYRLGCVGSKVESVISRAGRVVLCNDFAVRVAARSWQQLVHGEWYRRWKHWKRWRASRTLTSSGTSFVRRKGHCPRFRFSSESCNPSDCYTSLEMRWQWVNHYICEAV
jgi:hypothetical protein